MFCWSVGKEMALLVLRRAGLMCRAKPNVPFAGWQIVLKNVRWGKIKNSGSGKRVGLFLVRSLYIFYVVFHFSKWFTLSFYSVSVYGNGVFLHLLPTVTCMWSGGISKRNPVRPAGKWAQGLTCQTVKTPACHIQCVEPNLKVAKSSN